MTQAARLAATRWNLPKAPIHKRLHRLEEVAAERDFVDNSAPNYHILKAGEKPPADVIDPLTGDPIDQTPSVGAKSGLVRLGDLGSDVSCAQVRGASFGL